MLTPTDSQAAAKPEADVPDAPPFTIDADIDLGWGAAPWVRSHGADVTVRRADVPDALASPEAEEAAWACARGRLLFRPPCGLRLLVEGAERVLWAARPGLAEADVRLFVLQTALPALAVQRGLLALRASAVAVGHDVHSFVADSCWGKSTLAATLSGRGCPFFADSVLIVAPNRGSGSEVDCWRYDDLRLGPRGLAAAGLADAERRPVREAEGYEKFHVEPPARSPRTSGLLRTVHRVEPKICPPDEEDRLEIKRVAGSEMMRILWTAVCQPLVYVAALGEEETFRRVAALARAAKVYRFGFPLSNDARWLSQGVDAVAGRLLAPDAT